MRTDWLGLWILAIDIRTPSGFRMVKIWYGNKKPPEGGFLLAGAGRFT
ncbi:MAG: hypothetical protein HGA75_00265 [Thiobacillus sp.]|nr:hypothetical protein [Thiobacillus sp.]